MQKKLNRLRRLPAAPTLHLRLHFLSEEEVMLLKAPSKPNNVAPPYTSQAPAFSMLFVSNHRFVLSTGFALPTGWRPFSVFIRRGRTNLWMWSFPRLRGKRNGTGLF